MKVRGSISKMKTQLMQGAPVDYKLPLGNELVGMNDLLEKKVSLQFTGNIFDIHDGKPIKKSYGGGYSYKNFISLAQCDTCIVKPELCHFHQGTCREPEWGEKNCNIPHIIYLSITSGVKIGITRETQVPTRWIDQGAVQAIALLRVEDRRTSGLIEVEIAKTMADKTNWRNMLKSKYEPVDLEGMREQVYEDYGDLLDDMQAEDLDDPVQEIEYPIIEVPEKFSSFSFDKKELVEGTLLGIKGQYLIFDSGVINMRKHQGYEIEITA